jgi:CHRD domain
VVCVLTRCLRPRRQGKRRKPASSRSRALERRPVLKLARRNGREHCQPRHGRFPKRFPPRAGCDGGRASAVALGLAALIATSSDAFALKIPIQANLSGGGEVPSNNSPAKGVVEGTFDTDTNTLTWTVTYSGLSSPLIGAHFHGPVSYLGLTPEENAPIQVGTPGNLASPFHGSPRSMRPRPRT